MINIALPIYEDVVLSSVSGVLDIVAGVNGYLAAASAPPAFKITLVSERAKNIQLFLPAQFVDSKTLDEMHEADLIIVPAFPAGPDPIIEKNQALISWLREMHAQGTEVASLCMGSYFLAEAGLLKGKPCTSHWIAIADMKQRYPDINVLPDLVITDQDGIYTSGGAFSSLNLVLYLVEKFCGREAGIWASKMFSIDIDRNNQAHFAVFQGQRRHEDEEILKAQTYIEQNYHLPISIDQIAEITHMSKRNFIRRFKTATSNTPLEYLQRVKIESAKKALEHGGENISTLMYDVGYNDLKTFRMVFKRITGLTPQDYRRKYSRVAAEA
ncbi:GlxA family transcriptional regulator [Chitinophaga vietnamensis]|uniref:GlxA family transcriptional regulator n=1 Tax=Chitinophaga vietnamensis TaxID=2593957 RepID=UPI0011778F2F|nr:helix-turn-helix domain-containing protein [Chitinophaga vietnamensis]